MSFAGARALVGDDRAGAAADGSTEPRLIRAATYNIHSCVGMDRRNDPDRVLRVIDAIDPDILALQEVRAYSPDLDQFELFHKRLNMAPVFGRTFRARRFGFGNGLYVRGVVLKRRVVDLTIPPYEERCAIDAVVEVRGQRLRVVAAHLGLRPAERGRQIELLRDALAHEAERLTLVMGDLNVFGPERRRLMKIGAPMALKHVRTFPAPRPLMALDRLWSIPFDNLESLEAFSTDGARWASDHLPLVGMIRPLAVPS
jgi:endonuclease/exonuclease/phosphatase family metal-dependent hydrolase